MANCRMTGEVFALIRSIQEEQKQPKDYGTGQRLFHAEVGFLEAVHRWPKAKVSEISQCLDITKGAVTQMATKLTEKGLIESYKQEGNRKEKFFRLTALGEKARAGHEAFHEEANRKLCAYFCSLTDEQSETIRGFLRTLRESVPFCEFACANGDCNTGKDGD